MTMILTLSKDITKTLIQHDYESHSNKNLWENIKRRYESNLWIRQLYDIYGFIEYDKVNINDRNLTIVQTY